MYNILQARVEFKKNRLYKITVLVEMSDNDIRAIFATTEPRGGYMQIPPLASLNDELLQRVAGYGIETSIIDRDKIFSKWKHSYSKNKQTRLL